MGRFASKLVHRSFTLLVLIHAVAWGSSSAVLGDDTGSGQVNHSSTLSDASIWQPLSHDSTPPASSAIQPTAFLAEGMTFPVPTADDGDDSTEYQDAPGDDYPRSQYFSSEYARQYPRLPSYYFNPNYYDTWDIGARPLPDYAPPGYEPRDYESAPGEPEFERITPPTPLPESEPAGLVTRGMYPGSFLVPGTNTSFRLRGFVRMTGIMDFAPIGSADSFVTNTIPVPQQIGQNVNMTARPSRFSLESWTPTNYCDWNVHTMIEGDFFNGPAQAAGGGGNPFRLRHAFIDFGYFRVGQQNSVFMDGTNWPSLVDFQGPNSWANQRQPVARMTIPVVDGVYWATSVERCFSDITTNGQGTAVQDVPDFATHLRFQGDRGSHVQIASLLRTIGYRADDEEVTRRMGLGVNGNVVFHPWAWWMGTDPVHEEDPSGLTRSRILMQANWGPGLGRYVNDLAGQGLDAQVDPITGAFDLVEATAWNASYEHWYNSEWLSNFTYSQVSVDNTAGQPGSTYDSAKYVAASLWWIPIPRMSLGMEYLVGEREDLDGDSARARRFNALVQYNF